MTLMNIGAAATETLIGILKTAGTAEETMMMTETGAGIAAEIETETETVIAAVIVTALTSMTDTAGTFYKSKL